MYFSNCMHKFNKMLIVALATMGFASAKAQTTLPFTFALGNKFKRIG